MSTLYRVVTTVIIIITSFLQGSSEALFAGCGNAGVSVSSDPIPLCCFGYGVDQTGSCAPCPPGFYCDSGSSPTPCPDGTYNPTTSAKTQSSCIPHNKSCLPGFYVSSEATDTHNIGCSECKSGCPSGWYMQGSSCSGTGRSDSVSCMKCGACGPGYFTSPPCDGNKNVASKCVYCSSSGCAQGQYRGPCQAESDGACLNCTRCPGGQYNNGCGGNSAGVCTPCTSCGVGWTQFKACSQFEDTGCKGGACNTSISCGSLFCNYPVVSISYACNWKWKGASDGADINFLCTSSLTQGTCQQCPAGWTPSGAYCVECNKGQSCDRLGKASCRGQCAAGNFPVCDDVTGWAVCSQCFVNATFLNLGHRRLTRGGVLGSPDLCDAYFQCDVGFYLTSAPNQTGVTCEACSFPEPSQLGFTSISRGLTFGDKFSCIYKPTQQPVSAASNGVGQYGVPGSPLSSCPVGYTSMPGMAPTLADCLPCPNVPGVGGSFVTGRFDCAVRCDTSTFVQRGEKCITADRDDLRCDEDGYLMLPGGRCESTPLPWSEPGKIGTTTIIAPASALAHGRTIAAYDAASGYYATKTGLYTQAGDDLCNGLQSRVSNVAYVQDIPLFTAVCEEREMHTYYMVLKGDKFLYALLERTFGNNNRYVMWQVQTRIDADGRGSIGKVWQTWRLPAKVCSAAWSPAGVGADYIYLAFCDSPFLVYVRASDFSDGIADPDATTIDVKDKDGRQIFAIGRKYGIVIGQDKVGKSDGMRDVALFGPSLSVANTSEQGRLLIADRDNCRIVELIVVDDSPGSALTRATTIGSASCFSGPLPTPQPTLISSTLGGKMILFMTELGLVQMDYKFRDFQLIIPIEDFPAGILWIAVGEGGSTVTLVNKTHSVEVRRQQNSCPPKHESKRGAACTPCAAEMFVSPTLGICEECSTSPCEKNQARVPCGDWADAGCRNCTGSSPHPFRYGEDCTLILTAPCPSGYHEVTGGDCIPCPPTWSSHAYDAMSAQAICSCFRESAGATMDSDGVCVVASPFTSSDAGPMETPQWVRGFNCTYEDEGCRLRGCYLAGVFPRNCSECPEGLYGVNGMWCERCVGFRVPSPARDSCLCRPPSRIAERDDSGACVCPAGHEVTASGCEPCPKGKIQNTSVLMIDDYARQTTACAECPPGSTGNGDLATTCVPCPAGTYREAGMQQCELCGSSNFYPTDASDGGSCTACQPTCMAGQRWNPCPVDNTSFACEPCQSGKLSRSRSWVAGTDNRNCMWECNAGFYELGFDCWTCTRPVCSHGFVLTPCSRYEDGHCRIPCVNATKPQDNSIWGPDCTWSCESGFEMIEKVFFGWTEYLCELPSVIPWSGWW